MRSPILIGLLVVLFAVQARAAEVRADNLRDLFTSLDRCLHRRSVPAQAGSQITIRFALKRDGSLLGRPKITFAALPRKKAARQDFVAGVAGALARCLPVRITDGLGGAVAGRPLTIRLSATPPSTDI